MSKRVVVSACFTLFVAFAATTVVAFPPFKDAFKAKYVKADSTAANDAALAAAFDKAGCAVCHEGPTKKVRNAYGKQLEKLLKKSDAKNTAKINAALDKVAAMKSKAGDASSPTFGEKISSGKLPAQN